MHIFLTGEKQSGKTTVLRRFLEASGASADGIITRWEPQSGIPRCLHLYSFDGTEKHLLATDAGRGAEPVCDMVQVFDVHGAGLLNKSGGCGYTVIDELGTLERDAIAFQEAIMRRIGRDAPVLGVLSIKQSPFLDKIRCHPKVKLIEVTKDNREGIWKNLLR